MSNSLNTKKKWKSSTNPELRYQFFIRGFSYSTINLEIRFTNTLIGNRFSKNDDELYKITILSSA